MAVVGETLNEDLRDRISTISWKDVVDTHRVHLVEMYD